MARMTAKQFFFLKGFTGKCSSGPVYDFDGAYSQGLDLGVAKGIISKVKENSFTSVSAALEALMHYDHAYTYDPDKVGAWRVDKASKTPAPEPDEDTPMDPVPLPGPDDDVAKVVTELINAVSKGKKTIANLNSTIENLSANILQQNNQIDTLNAKVEELTKNPGIPSYNPSSTEYIKPAVYDRARWLT
jgi:hypothetical protein